MVGLAARAADVTEPIDIPESDDDLLAAVRGARRSAPAARAASTRTSPTAPCACVHRPSGLTVTCRAQRSQYLNKMDALRRLRLKLRR